MMNKERLSLILYIIRQWRYITDMLFHRKETAEERRQKKLAAQYTELTERLSEIRTNFDLAEEAELIDALIYEENALLARLSALYKEAKNSGIRLEIYELKK